MGEAAKNELQEIFMREGPGKHGILGVLREEENTGGRQLSGRKSWS